MKILGICGSPRKGNSEWMLSKVMESAGQNGAEVETLLLRRLDIQQCRGCLACEVREEGQGRCRIKDDMAEINRKAVAADVIVMATPAYFELLSGLLKNFIDRTCPIWPRLAGKRMAGLAVAEEGTGQAIHNLRTYASLCKMQWIGSVSTLAKTPGEAAKKPGLEARLRRLGLRLTNDL
jgi:multimeric flavodoxin WrbA